MHHGALHYKTNGIDFLVVHFSPKSIKRRREETKILLSKLEQIRAEKPEYIILGDFNSHSPFGANLYDANGELLNTFEETKKGRSPDGNLNNNHLDYSFVSDFLSFPMYDVTRIFTIAMMEGGSFPGLVLGAVNNENDDQLLSRMERIDYILVSSELETKCLNAKVCNGEENWYLSDHYPVVAEFDYAVKEE